MTYWVTLLTLGLRLRKTVERTETGTTLFFFFLSGVALLFAFSTKKLLFLFVVVSVFLLLLKVLTGALQRHFVLYFVALIWVLRFCVKTFPAVFCGQIKAVCFCCSFRRYELRDLTKQEEHTRKKRA